MANIDTKELLVDAIQQRPKDAQGEDQWEAQWEALVAEAERIARPRIDAYEAARARALASAHDIVIYP